MVDVLQIIAFPNAVWNLSIWIKLPLYIFALTLATYVFWGKELGLSDLAVSLPPSTYSTVSQNNTQSINNAGSGPISAPVQNVNTAGGTMTQKNVSSPTWAPRISLFHFEYHVALQSEQVYKVDDGLLVDKEVYEIQGSEGHAADLTAYVLYRNAAWAMHSAEKFVRHDRGEFTDLTSFLNGDEFSERVQTFGAIVCLGTASGHMQTDPANSVALSDRRAVTLCGLVSKRIEDISVDIPVFGLPLGFHTDTAVTARSKKETQQRAIVIVGINLFSNAIKGKFQEFIAQLLREDGLKGFRTSQYSKIRSQGPLKLLHVDRSPL